MSKTTPKKLYRSESSRMIAGIAGGFGEYFSVDPIIVRLVFVLVTLAGGSGILIYIILWVILPSKSKVVADPKDIVKDNLEDIKTSAEDFVEEVKSTVGK